MRCRSQWSILALQHCALDKQYVGTNLVKIKITQPQCRLLLKNITSYSNSIKVRGNFSEWHFHFIRSYVPGNIFVLCVACVSVCKYFCFLSFLESICKINWQVLKKSLLCSKKKSKSLQVEKLKGVLSLSPSVIPWLSHRHHTEGTGFSCTPCWGSQTPFGAIQRQGVFSTVNGLIRLRGHVTALTAVNSHFFTQTWFPVPQGEPKS